MHCSRQYSCERLLLSRHRHLSNVLVSRLSFDSMSVWLFVYPFVCHICLFVRLRKLASHLAILFVICCCFCWCFLSSFFLVNSLLVWLPYAFSLYCFLRLFSSVCCCCCCCVYRFSCCYSAAVGVIRVLSAWLSFGSCCLPLVSVVLLHVMFTLRLSLSLLPLLRFSVSCVRDHFNLFIACLSIEHGKSFKKWIQNIRTYWLFVVQPRGG